MSAELRLDQWSDLSVESVFSGVESGTISGQEGLRQLSAEEINLEGSRAFIARHPDFPQTELNGVLMQEWLDQRNVPATVKNLEVAWRTLAAGGWLEKSASATNENGPKIHVRGKGTPPPEDYDEPVFVDADHPYVERRNSDGTSENVDLENEIKRLSAIAADRTAPDNIRKAADGKLKFLVRTDLARKRSPRLHEQKCVI